MFNVVRIRTGEIVTVYGVSKDHFLIYEPNHPVSPRWVWLAMRAFKPVEETECPKN